MAMFNDNPHFISRVERCRDLCFCNGLLRVHIYGRGREKWPAYSEEFLSVG